MPEGDISFLVIVSLGRHSRPGINNLPREEIRRIRTDVADHSTVRGCRLLVRTEGRVYDRIFSEAPQVLVESVD